MSKKRLSRIPPAMISQGKPTPVPIYTEAGRLLLNQGNVISSEKQVEQVISRGFYEIQTDALSRRGSKSDKGNASYDENPFAQYYQLLINLQNTFKSIGNKNPQSSQRLEKISTRIVTMCQYDVDAALGLVHVYAIDPSAYEQALLYGVLGGFAAQQLALNEKQTQSLVKACLTANIALLPYADRLNRSRQKLAEKQRSVVRRHPEIGAAMLDNASIKDSLCRKIVLQHHECFDGSGYPNQLTGDALSPMSKILAFIERYMAMTTKRAYKTRMSPNEAISNILSSFEDDPHLSIFVRLSKAMTNYPPGSMVTLKNGEYGVIVRRNPSMKGHFLKALGSSNKLYMGPLSRETTSPEYQIAQAVIPKTPPAMDFSSIWGYSSS